MDSLSKFVAMILAVSVAAERMVEILKGWFPNSPLFAARPDATAESKRSTMVTVVAGACGTIAAWVGHINVLSALGGGWADWLSGQHPQLGDLGGWLSGHSAGLNLALSYAVAGVLSSGGSAFWNHALDLLKATKVQQEQTAIDTVAANKQKNLLDASMPSSFALAMSPSAAASPTAAGTATCLTTPDPNRPVILARVGTLGFSLVTTGGSTFNFVPGACSVTGPGGAKVAFTQATTSLLEFKATQAGTYILAVGYFSTQGSTANLEENCSSPWVIDELDDSDKAKNYTIEVS